MQLVASDVLSSPQTSSIISKENLENLMFLFTRTSSTIHVSRLPSRRLIWSIDTSSSTEDLWRSAWDLPANSEIVDDPTVPVPGANLPRREWCILNRFRSGAGRCAASLHRWVIPTTHCASVEPPRPCRTSSTAAWYTSSKVVSLPSTQRLIPRWSGCAIAAYAKERSIMQ